jgi:PHD/YefM family antitoxin component YafN of YafNO toxin-antitoxin module
MDGYRGTPIEKEADMTRRMSMLEARRKLMSLPEEFEQDPEGEAVAITRRGKPVLAVMPWGLYESMVETLEILSDTELVAALRESIRDLKEGHTVSMQEVERELGL